MFTHAVNIDSTEVWLEYRTKLFTLGVPKIEILDLLDILAYTAETDIASNENPTK